MMRVLFTVFAGLLGLAFGSFLNVCLSRWPEGESVVKPRSHCRNCGRTLAWWENVPLVSWVALRGRCKGCGSRIGFRYVAVEAAVGALWAVEGWRLASGLIAASASDGGLAGDPFLDTWYAVAEAISKMTLYWLLIALAALDAEQLWLPDWLTLPGIGIGVGVSLVVAALESLPGFLPHVLMLTLEKEGIAIFAGAGLIVTIRWSYRLLRRREGMGLGDAKLMALLGAWLGFPGMLLAFGLGVVAGAVAGVAILVLPSARSKEKDWALSKLPLGTFLCAGGIISGLWGREIIEAYLRWAGFSY